MKKSKINLNLSKFGDADLEARSLAIIAAMTGNAHFPEPAPSLADLTNSTQLFADALALAQSRDKVKVAEKNNLRRNLQLLLTELASYCDYTAKGDRAILASSGFPLNAASSTPKTLAAPENFTVQPGYHSGEAFLSINRVANATSYLFLYGPSPIVNEAWLHAVGSSPYFTIAGLVPNTVYSFKIGAMGSKGQVLYTAPVSTMVI